MYGMNVEGISSTAGNTATPWAIVRPTGTGVFGFKMSQVRHSAEKLMFVDAQTSAAAVIVDESGSGPFPGTNGKISNYDLVQERTGAGTLPQGAFDANRMTAWRHRGGANVAFFDGHVAWLKKGEIYSLDSTGKIVGNDRLWKVLQ